MLNMNSKLHLLNLLTRKLVYEIHFSVYQSLQCKFIPDINSSCSNYSSLHLNITYYLVYTDFVACTVHELFSHLKIKKLYKAELYDCIYCALIRELNTRFGRHALNDFVFTEVGMFCTILNKI